MIFYSGLEDPFWEVNSKDLKHAKITNLVTAAMEAGLIYDETRIPAMLGYKGFLLKVSKSTEIKLVIGDKTKELQTLLFESMPQNTMNEKSKLMIQKGIKLGGLLPTVIPKKPPVLSKRWAPEAYGLNTWYLWSFEGDHQINNNCYNYGNDKRTDTYAQPGRGSANPFPRPLTADGVLRASLADGLVTLVPQPVRGAVGIPNIPVPANLHLVALVVDEGKYG